MNILQILRDIRAILPESTELVLVGTTAFKYHYPQWDKVGDIDIVCRGEMPTSVVDFHNAGTGVYEGTGNLIKYIDGTKIELLKPKVGTHNNVVAKYEVIRGLEEAAEIEKGIYVVSPESVILVKMGLWREKDRNTVERMLKVHNKPLPYRRAGTYISNEVHQYIEVPNWVQTEDKCPVCNAAKINEIGIKFQCGSIVSSEVPREFETRKHVSYNLMAHKNLLGVKSLRKSIKHQGAKDLLALVEDILSEKGE